MITTYTRAKHANKLTGFLHTNDTVKLASMDTKAKVERINKSKMSFRMRLSAIQAVSNSTAKSKVWA